MVLVYPQIITGADLLRGIIKLDHLAPLLKRRGAKTVGIVNSRMYGVRSFCKTMKKYDIHTAIGLSIHLALDDERTVLLYGYAKDDRGYSNLLKISSAIAISEKETLPLKWLKAYSEGCIFICPMTDKTWDLVRQTETLQLISDACETVFVGISRAGGVRHEDESLIEETATACGLSISATHESRYLAKEDAFSYEVATAIRAGYKLNDPSRPQQDIYNAYVPEEEELQQWFSDRPQWLETMADMLISCTAELPPSRTLMPAFPLPQNTTAADLLKRHCEKGLKSRVSQFGDEYTNRLHYELTIIEKMGFSDYFLIVEDFMAYAKEQGILTGPGRGSSAGSLVAYTLGITDVDPIKYGLIFERFLNPGRITMPDIDIDFADNRRSEVIEYVARKYGKSHVAQIITFGTLSAKSVARNVARVFDFSADEMTFISRQIKEGQHRDLAESVKRSKPLQDWIALDPNRTKWLQAAIALEGLPRNASTHAAGVILSPVPLVENVPVQIGGDDFYLTQWAMGDVEEVGLLKMDFLGLRNLTLLDRIRSMIEYDRKVRLKFEEFPMDDTKTFDLFKEGDMTGIFQFESDGMRDALRLIRPDEFKDLYAINALYRPGPMENIALYSRRKNGKEKVDYIHPLLEPILKETEGIIVYQEQIMQIAVQIAGFSMAEADLLRRAVSKKKREILQQEQNHFVNNAIKKGFPEKSAREIYDLIVKFADYGFPKSHAVAYSLISYQLAYIKANEPIYFYAALLAMATGNQEKTMELIHEIRSKGIPVLPPSIQKSRYGTVVEGSSIRIGLGAVKGVAPSFYEIIKDAKTSKPWQNLFDFAAAIGGAHFTEKAIVPLVKSGALDEFGENRSVLLASIDAAANHAVFVSPEEDDLLHDVIFSIAKPKYSPGGTMPRLAMLEFEREVLGFYLSEHPALEMKKMNTGQLVDLSEVEKVPTRQTIRVVGLIQEVKRIRTKKGEAMAFMTLQDETGELSCTLFPKTYAVSNVQLQDLTMVQVEGTVEERNGQFQMIVQQVLKI
ncbi:exodeoxyribonuclease VII large subunit [Sporosarcina sp. Sa2YVA2]|uniref:DNA-directed DNA polymerase n=1 Tax=Sporosarcina quadrami TaxID=2762234 RepID=A0ABR8U991_9BACL|nr:exodeoxyribonuclease VII large subunit [Sporosarcina quadrami]MBD7984283.1 exodeoxyribonuclease VII large subunit [Sporosarcina quadrami]